MSQKSSILIRPTADLHIELKELAEEAGFSMNELVCSILEWAVAHGHVGYPASSQEAHGLISIQWDHPCVWFGREAGPIEDEYGEPREWDQGKVHFCIERGPSIKISGGRADPVLYLDEEDGDE